MAGQRPRQGWIYFINPYRMALKCKSNHIHIYDLDQLGEVECKTCKSTMGSSRVLRGEHPYIIWTSDKFQDELGYIATFSAVPLTSQTTFNGLPTTYPINPTSRNGLDKQSYALVNQICTVDANCFKDASGNWLERIGQLDKSDKDAIEERLKYYLNIQENPSDDWFIQNASIDLLKKVFEHLPDTQKTKALEELLDLD
ncbi:MAG TPA: type II toxin-antitoxin system PemK/MazF family toxin [Nostocaceae cyanobacterium]|nr:type II toxin-antitoxin system PemK/MazF family toxin [Nostocaceae cyanobacterium]